MRLAGGAAGILKAVGEAFHFIASPWISSSVGSKVDYGNKVGRGLNASVIMGPVLFLARTFPEAPLVVKLGDDAPTQDHDMPRLIKRPNAFYTGRLLWMASIISLHLAGNAYWLKLRTAGGFGLPGELWFAPPWITKPVRAAQSPNFIDYYEYSPQGRAIRIAPSEVVHLRYGLDPENPMMGLAPLQSVLREVYTDEEAANFTGTLLRNAGVPGVVVAPAEKSRSVIGPQEAQEVKAYIKQMTTGDRRGEPLVLPTSTTVSQFGFNPQQMDLKSLRRIPEERVTSVLGVPAIVAGLGAGLDRSTFANFSEAREAAYETGIIPMQAMIGEQLEPQLLAEWEDLDNASLGFDLSRVRILQEDGNALAERWRGLVDDGLARLDEGREALGLEVKPEHQVWYQKAGRKIVKVLAETPNTEPVVEEPTEKSGHMS